MAEDNGTEKPYPYDLIHSKSNDLISCTYNRKRSVQYTNEHESSSHTPKRNRVEASDCDIEFEQHPSKLGQNKQGTAKMSTATTTISSYFNNFNMGHQLKKSYNDSSTRSRRESPRQTFPPFRITPQDVNQFPTTEVSVIKEINKYCKLNLTYGRYTKSSENQMCFLLYASTTTQFEYLMCETNWPSTINNTKYKLDLPNKIPSSYSLVVQNVPRQWSAQDFGNELKQHYPSIVRAVRLYINGGRPLPKVRVDFSSYKDLSMILKAKRILLDDDNTAFAVEPYLPPTRILRCYNCQAYDDHIAAHCPNKNNPVCFRCAQHHPYNPKCDNPIRCAHCQGEHMAGNPSCPVKSEKRQEKNQRLKICNEASTSTSQQQHKQAWTGNVKEHLFDIETAATSASPKTIVNNNNNNYQTDIVNMFEKINNTMLHIKQQQDELNGKFDTLERKLNYHNNDIKQINYCIYDILCPLVKEISNQIHLKAKGVNKQTISPLYNKLVDFISKNTISNNNNNINDLSGDKSSAQERSTSNCESYQSTIYES
jgi:hypothetical protein